MHSHQASYYLPNWQTRPCKGFSPDEIKEAWFRRWLGHVNWVYQWIANANYREENCCSS